MKKLFFCVYTCVAVFLISCNRMPEMFHTGIVINVPLVHEEPTDYYDFFCVFDSLTPIRLSNDSVNGLITFIEDIHIDGDLIFIRDVNTVHVFDMEGRFIRNIGRKGRGRGEYLGLMDFDLNRPRKELTIYDQGAHRFLVYDYEGNFLRQFEYEYIVREFATLPNGDYLVYRPDYEKNAHRGLFQIDSTGKIKKHLLQYDDYLKAYSHSGKCLCRINDGLLALRGLDCMNSIYHITQDTIYEAYQIVTDSKYDRRFVEKELPTDGDLEKYDFYHIIEMVETERHIEFNIVATSNWAKVYYDKKTNKTYRRYGKEWSDLMEAKPSDLYEHFMTTCENGLNMGFLTTAAILKNPAYQSLFPDITEESNPVLFYSRVKEN